MTALENVLVGMHIAAAREPLVDAVLRTPRQRARGGRPDHRARELLGLVGLEGRADELARNLPYGDQRRLEIARALASEPSCCCSTSPRPA